MQVCQQQANIFQDPAHAITYDRDIIDNIRSGESEDIKTNKANAAFNRPPLIRMNGLNNIFGKAKMNSTNKTI